MSSLPPNFGEKEIRDAMASVEAYGMKCALHGTKRVLIVVDTCLATGSALLTANGELHVGPNTDLEVLFFHMNMTPRDKRLLAAMKIGL